MSQCSRSGFCMLGTRAFITQPRGARYVTMLRIEILHAMYTGSAQPRSAQHVTARQIVILHASYTDSAHPRVHITQPDPCRGQRLVMHRMSSSRPRGRALIRRPIQVLQSGFCASHFSWCLRKWSGQWKRPRAVHDPGVHKTRSDPMHGR